MLAWLHCFNNFLVVKNSRTARKTSNPTISHDVLKNNEPYPSGPGALSLSVLNKEILTSSIETKAVSESQHARSRQGP
ncbi:hypothetical protein F511_34394 [Dorcoceras hygrometricum]|uniref:Uncharacterized protein n=1 Tax=Dorcoceras hygrometricum TaxID=472368 RepID=A0A2Z7DE24_9LAMI|nr:hypothetical protein F511_34394 [Dorcoceras hygrometricum]